MEPVSELLASALAAVKAAPTDPSVRMKLFRVFCLTGQWDRAVIQLDTASGMDAELAMTSLLYKQAIACEQFRAQVFVGSRTPVVLGEPQPWLGWMMEALRSEPARAMSLRAQAMEAAIALPGSLNGEEFEWLADADPRLGPVCESFIDGKYYWLPFDRIAELTIEPPDDMLDLVWTRAEVVLGNGGSKLVLVPSRYPGSEASGDDTIRTCRRTEWSGSDATGYLGLGQREWVTDRGETGLLDVRRLVLLPQMHAGLPEPVAG
jgi:type VI secretion system protein ImpE